MFSMTGYGKACKNIEGRELTIELKAVNHRFLDLNIKMPRIFNAFEDLLRKTISAKISRGHVDVYVNFMDKSEREKSVQVDIGLAKGYVVASQKLNQQFNLIDDFTLTSLMRTPDVLKVVAEDDDENLLRQLIEQTANEACDNLNKMREFEGAKIKADLLARIANVETFWGQIKQQAPVVAKEYAEKLKARISEALADVKYDEAKFLNEVAFFVDKSNVDEEIARLGSHIAHFRDIIQEENAGKKLDFLVQELNRETNTICSKSNNAELTTIGLALKNEIEKIREQVQNAE